MDRWNTELDQLFAKYKDAVPDPDPGTNFMPGLWRKIEARQSFTTRIKKLTQVFVVTTAAVCLMLGMAVVVPGSLHPELRGTYVDVLAEAHPPDNLTALGIHVEPVEATTK
jgi:hypothetical protein